MNTDTDTTTVKKSGQNATPVFFRLLDNDEDKTERTVSDLTELAEKLGISDLLQLHSIMHSPDDGFVSVFSLNLETGMKGAQAESSLSFLEYVFKNMFHKHPAYTEPIL